MTRLRDIMLNTTADPVVATACRESGLVLVTHNIKDFHKIVKEYEVTKRECDTLNRIEMACNQSRALERITEAIDLIEYEWNKLGKTKAGLRIYVGNSNLRTYR